MLKISNTLFIREEDISFQAIRAQGPGGQNVNKVASAVQLRFDIHGSDLSEYHRKKILALNDRRISKDGVVVIKSQNFRSQEKNREAALNRLAELIRTAVRPVRKRKPTRPTRSSRKKRMESKTRHGKLKALRQKIRY